MSKLYPNWDGKTTDHICKWMDIGNGFYARSCGPNAYIPYKTEEELETCLCPSCRGRIEMIHN